MLEPPDARPIAGGKYRLHGDYTYESLGPTPFTMTVPDGFIWDGSSVPRFLWTISGITPDGLMRAGALIHDYLYRNGGVVSTCTVKFSRKDADVLFYTINRQAGCNWWTAIRAYRAVRLFGWLAWRKPSNGRKDVLASRMRA